ncbi:MAG: hypothetical protein M3N16_00775 [Actinomycetota bacterium]|nr:hypothetical protein [Actinomycetota bacterium]
MTELLRVGGVARLDPEGEREIRLWREELGRGEIDEPEATRARLEAHERGDAVVVRLDLFADVLAPDGGIERHDGARVVGLWFYAGRRTENIEHAREMVVDNLDRLAADLAEAGFPVDASMVENVPIRVEVEERLERELGER